MSQGIVTDDVGEERGDADQSLCKYCANIDLERLEKGYCHGPTFRDALTINRDCHFCRMVLEGLAADHLGNRQDLPEWIKDKRIFLQGAIDNGVQPGLTTIATEHERRSTFGVGYPPARLTCIIITHEGFIVDDHDLSDYLGAVRYAGALRVFATEGTPKPSYDPIFD